MRNSSHQPIQLPALERRECTPEGAFLVSNRRDRFEQTVDILRLVSHGLELVWAEISSRTPLPLSDALFCWKRGFRRRSYRLYDLRSSALEQYISDWAQYVRGVRINGQFDPFINNKAVFPSLMDAVGLPYPRTLGSFGATSRSESPALEARKLSEWIQRLDGIVLKPVKGCHGAGLYIVKPAAGGCVINGIASKLSAFEHLLPQFQNYLATEFIIQHAYAAQVFPSTTNTIRLLTMWDDQKQSPFLAAAAHRFGTSRSFPVDNFRAGAGGLSAEIDLLTGSLGPAATLSTCGTRLEWHETHPETGAQIQGIELPDWSELSTRIVQASARMPFVSQIAWDIVICSTGFCVLEINGCPGLAVHQVHRPLLADPRVQRFYARHNVL